MSELKLTGYIPTNPTVADENSMWAHREFVKLSQAIKKINETVPRVEYSAPDKPQQGQQAYAKSPWNPGNGDGLYIYDGTSWQWAEGDTTAYLPLTGGTLTGTLNGTSASFSSTLHATGNITTGGTVDGRDVASDGTKLDGIESGAEVNDAYASVAQAEAMSSTTVMMNPARTEDSIKHFRKNIQTKSASYTITAAEADHYYTRVTASINITVPPNSGTAIEIGAQFEYINTGASSVITFVAGAGVTINSFDSTLTVSDRYKGALLTKVGTDEWDLVGGLG